MPKTTQTQKGGFYHIFSKSNEKKKRKKKVFSYFWVGVPQLFVEFFYIVKHHANRLGSWWLFKRFHFLHQGSAREVSATEPLHPTRRVLGGKMVGERLTFL